MAGGQTELIARDIVGLRDRLRMLAAEDRQVIFRSCKARNAADAYCIGKFRNAAGAEKRR